MFDTLNPTYDVMIIDPPWSFKTYSDKGMDRSPDSHYNTMNLEDIKKMPINDILSKNAIVYLWATAPMLRYGIDCIDSWGLKYVSQMIWDKKKIALGYWTRNQHEIILIAKKGSPKAPEPKKRIPSLFSEARREHSRKPDFLHRHIEDYFPESKKVEIFSRQSRNGWDVWGNEVNKFDIIQNTP